MCTRTTVITTKTVITVQIQQIFQFFCLFCDLHHELQKLTKASCSSRSNYSVKKQNPVYSTTWTTSAWTSESTTSRAFYFHIFDIETRYQLFFKMASLGLQHGLKPWPECPTDLDKVVLGHVGLHWGSSGQSKAWQYFWAPPSRPQWWSWASHQTRMAASSSCRRQSCQASSWRLGAL